MTTLLWFSFTVAIGAIYYGGSIFATYPANSIGLLAVGAGWLGVIYGAIGRLNAAQREEDHGAD